MKSIRLILLILLIFHFGLLAEDLSEFSLTEKGNVEVEENINSDTFITQSELAKYVDESFKNKEQKIVYCPRSFTLPLQKGHIFLGGEYLYWKPYAFISYAVKYERSISGPTGVTAEDNPQVNLKAHAGYRLLLGFYLPRCTWYCEAQYTQFFARGGDFLDSETPSNGVAFEGSTRFFWVWSGLNLTSGASGLRDASATERVRVKIVDGVLSRTFATNSCFTLDPFFGLRYARLKVDMNIFCKEQQSTGIFEGQFGTNDIDLTNDFNSFGLRAGLKTNWLLGCGFEIFGESSFSVLAGKFVLRSKQRIVRINIGDYTFKTLTNATSREDIYNNFQFGLGLIWGKQIRCSYFGIKVGYEMSIWPSLIRLTRTIDPVLEGSFYPNSSGNRNNLSMRGLTASARLDF
jgi:Legionella pneumophila major outer membrane protein precursor